MDLIQLALLSFTQCSSVSSNTYRIRLVALNGHLFLTRAYFAGYAEASNKVYQINYFLNTLTQTYISITQRVFEKIDKKASKAICCQ
jgi:hypothetical protein